MSHKRSFLKFRLSGQHRLLSLAAACHLLVGCSSAPLEPYTTAVEPLALMPISAAGITDQRGRFREIYCAVLDREGAKPEDAQLPDYMPCDRALTRVGEEPAGSGKPIALGQATTPLVAVLIPGVGWDCFSNWMHLQNSVQKHLQQFGYDLQTIQVDTLSGVEINAQKVRDGVLALSEQHPDARLVLIGYSKGGPDILEALVTYPEIHSRISAVISAGGAIGGSPLANDASQSQVDLLKHWPGAECTEGDGGTVESLRPAVRKNWLAQHVLPDTVPYYSLVTYPEPERISWLLKSSYKKLSQIDPRNDGQILFYDQLIPGSTLLGYINADHWSLAVPISRAHGLIGSTVVDENTYPREALVEAVLRFIDEQTATPVRPPINPKP